MGRTARTWAQKLADARAKAPVPTRWHCEKSGMEMSIPGVPELEDVMRQIPPGRLATIGQIGDVLTRRHGVDKCCPLTTGIFAWLIANGSEDGAGPEGDAPAPWWRVLKTSGEINPKYPGGGTVQQARLEAEGHRIVRKGKLLVVDGFANRLAEIE